MLKTAKLTVLNGVFKVCRFAAVASAASASFGWGYQPKQPQSLGK